MDDGSEGQEVGPPFDGNGQEARTGLPKQLPKDIGETLDAWLAYKRRWWFIHYFFGISALVGAVTVASGYGFTIVAWYTAVCVAIVTFLTPSRRARAYVSAARILSDARNRYLNDPDYPLEKLLDAVKEGEDLIARADPI